MATIVEYIWLSGKDTHSDIRSKCKTFDLAGKPADSPDSYPLWNFDGSSTAQAMGEDTEIVIKPVRVFSHPFIEGGKVVLCECYYPSGEPTTDNTRVLAKAVFDKGLDLAPWFGAEQEYVLYQNNRPVGFPETGYPAPQGPYYCGSSVSGRPFVLEHYQLCLKMGLKIAGINAEVMLGQWEYQVGPCEGIEAGDHIVMSRWVYQRLGELRGFQVEFHSKPVKGDWNGSGMHMNYSTKPMREDGGLAVIKEKIENLKETVADDVPFYGTDNNERLTGKHETSRLDLFNFGVGTRHTSIRIPNEVAKNGKGYFEDRRPSSSADPYLVTSRLFASSNKIAVPAEFDARRLGLYQDWMARMLGK